MAFVNVKGATVGDKLGDKGFNLVESWTKQDGTVVKTYYKVWTSEQWDAGTVVDVSGILSVKADLYEGDAKVSISINNARIAVGVAREAVAAVKTILAPVDSPF